MQSVIALPIIKGTEFIIKRYKYMRIETAKDLLDFIYPEHDRTTCSDNNLNNGFYSRNEDGFGRCTRCMYLELLSGSELPPKVKEAKENNNDYAIRG